MLHAADFDALRRISAQLEHFGFFSVRVDGKGCAKMITTELSARINDLLRPMGITRNMSAYGVLQQCLELICEREDRLQAVRRIFIHPLLTGSSVTPRQSRARSAGPPRWYGPRTLPMCNSWRATR